LVGAEGLGDILLEIGRERQLRVEVIDDAPLVRLVQHHDVVVPEHQFLLLAASLLSPQGHHSRLVGHEHDVTAGQLRGVVLLDEVAQLPDVLLAVAGRIRTDGCGRQHSHQRRLFLLCSHVDARLGLS